MSCGWIGCCFPGPGPHLLTSLCLYLFLSLLHDRNTHTFKAEHQVHTAAQDGGQLEGCLCRSEATQNHIVYIIFSVCLHRHSIGVLGGGGWGGHVHTTLTSHLQVICSCFIWASGSAKFWRSYSVRWAHFVTVSFCFSFSRCFIHTEVPVLLVWSPPLVAIYIVYLVCFQFVSFPAGMCWAERRPVCVCVLCMLPWWSQVLVTPVCRGGVAVVGLFKVRLHHFELVLSFVTD